MRTLLLILMSLGMFAPASADIVKPALVEFLCFILVTKRSHKFCWRNVHLVAS